MRSFDSRTIWVDRQSLARSTSPPIEFPPPSSNLSYYIQINVEGLTADVPVPFRSL